MFSDITQATWSLRLDPFCPSCIVDQTLVKCTVAAHRLPLHYKGVILKC